MDPQIRKQLEERLQDALLDAAQRIDRCLDEDETFRDMCEDYEECTLGLQRWDTSPERPEERIEEYLQLLRDLEEEILQFLSRRD